MAADETRVSVELLWRSVEVVKHVGAPARGEVGNSERDGKGRVRADLSKVERRNELARRDFVLRWDRSLGSGVAGTSFDLGTVGQRKTGGLAPVDKVVGGCGGSCEFVGPARVGVLERRRDYGLVESCVEKYVSSCT